MTDDAREAAQRIIAARYPAQLSHRDAHICARALLASPTAAHIAALVETYTDILSPETARKVARRIRGIEP